RRVRRRPVSARRPICKARRSRSPSGFPTLLAFPRSPIPILMPARAAWRGSSIFRDGTHTHLRTHSYNGFPTATAAEFRDLLLAIAASGPDAPKPTPLEKFFETHPIAKTFLTSEKPAPVSFGTLPYFGVNTFKL